MIKYYETQEGAFLKMPDGKEPTCLGKPDCCYGKRCKWIEWSHSEKTVRIKEEFKMEFKVIADKIYFDSMPKGSYLDVKNARKQGITLPNDIEARVEIKTFKEKVLVKMNHDYLDDEWREIKTEYAILKPIQEETTNEAVEFHEWGIINAFVTRIDGKLMHHYPKEKGQGADIRTHNYQYTTQELYEIFKQRK